MSYLDKAKKIRSRKLADPEALQVTKETNYTNKGLETAQTSLDEVRNNLPDTLPRLPWQLERLIAAASSGVLELSLPGVPDAERYVMGCACTYLLGDRDEGLRRLWEARHAWKVVN